MGNCLKCLNGDSSVGAHSPDVSRTYPDRTISRIASYLENDPILHPTPGISMHMSQLTEEEQVKIATRMGLIATLPLIKFDKGKHEKLGECVICMCDYEEGEELRYLPCMHTYHRVCIDDWLMRALICPCCLEEPRPSSPDVTSRSLCSPQDPLPSTNTAATAVVTRTDTTTTSFSSPHITRRCMDPQEDILPVSGSEEYPSLSSELNVNSNRPLATTTTCPPAASQQDSSSPVVRRISIKATQSGEGETHQASASSSSAVPSKKARTDCAVVVERRGSAVDLTSSSIRCSWAPGGGSTHRQRSGSCTPAIVDRRTRNRDRQQQQRWRQGQRGRVSSHEEADGGWSGRERMATETVRDGEEEEGDAWQATARCRVNGDSSLASQKPHL